MKMVWATRVVTRNFIKDFIGEMENILGHRIKTYEKMIDVAIAEACKELREKYGSIRNVKIEVSFIAMGAMVVVVYADAD